MGKEGKGTEEEGWWSVQRDELLTQWRPDSVSVCYCSSASCSSACVSGFGICISHDRPPSSLFPSFFLSRQGCACREYPFKNRKSDLSPKVSVSLRQIMYHSSFLFFPKFFLTPQSLSSFSPFCQLPTSSASSPSPASLPSLFICIFLVHKFASSTLRSCSWWHR